MLRSLRTWFVALALLAFLPSLSPAQEPSPTDTTQVQQQMSVMGQQMQAMVPMMTQMMRQMTQSTMAALAEPETAQNLARFTRNYYNALVAQGFTEEQALRIVSNMGFPPLPNM